MAIDLERCAQMYQDNRTPSPAFVSSTFEQDKVSTYMHSMTACIPDGAMFIETNLTNLHPVMELHMPASVSTLRTERSTPLQWSTSATVDIDVFAQDGNSDLESCLDPNDIPPTREPSPEPLWQNRGEFVRNGQNLTEQIHVSGRHIPTEPVAKSLCSNSSTCRWNEEHSFARQDRFDDRHVPRTSSREPPVQRAYASAPSEQPHQMVYVVPNQVVVPNHDATMMWQMNSGGAMPFSIQTWPTPQQGHETSNVQMLLKEESFTQSCQFPSYRTPASEPQRAQLSEPSTQTPAEPMKKSAKGKNVHGEGSSKFGILSEGQKEALCQHIYHFMLEKGFTNPDGYLVVDVFAELWKDCFFKDLGETADSWRVAHVRFSELLCSAPHLFEHFRKRFRVDKRCAWLDRKGQKMVRLVIKK
jgi:hypothetical protein